MEFIANVFAFKILIVSLLFRITVYFLLFLYDSDSKFYFLELLFFFFFNLCLFPSVYSNQQSTAFATIVSEALFCLCRGTNIITLLGCDRITGHVPRLLYISISFLFFCGFLFCWCERNTGRHFIGFY